MRRFVGACDAVVHLAARNRPTDDPAVFETNVHLTETLIRALTKAVKVPQVLFASSIREGEATAFGQSKKACRELLEAWAGKSGRRLTTMRIPNVFGAEARPFDNSFIATFSWQLLHGMEPVVTEERVVPLVHVDSLCRQIAAVIRGEREGVEVDFRMPVGEVLGVLRGFWEEFQAAGRVAVPADRNLADLRCFCGCFFHFFLQAFYVTFFGRSCPSGFLVLAGHSPQAASAPASFLGCRSGKFEQPTNE